MEEKDLIRLNGFDDQKQSLCQEKDFYLGKTNLQVRLAPDMDEKFLERLGHILRSETSPSKNPKK